MNPKFLEMMAHKVRKGRYRLCPNGSHLDMYDDQQVYMKGIIEFIRDVDAGRFLRTQTGGGDLYTSDFQPATIRAALLRDYSFCFLYQGSFPYIRSAHSWHKP